MPVRMWSDNRSRDITDLVTDSAGTNAVQPTTQPSKAAKGLPGRYWRVLSRDSLRSLSREPRYNPHECFM